MMMSLGTFVFSLQTAAYQQLQRQMSWRHPASERVGARAARQYVGPGRRDHRPVGRDTCRTDR